MEGVKDKCVFFNTIKINLLFWWVVRGELEFTQSQNFKVAVCVVTKDISSLLTKCCFCFFGVFFNAFIFASTQSSLCSCGKSITVKLLWKVTARFLILS